MKKEHKCNCVVGFWDESYYGLVPAEIEYFKHWNSPPDIRVNYCYKCGESTKQHYEWLSGFLERLSATLEAKRQAKRSKLQQAIDADAEAWYQRVMAGIEALAKGQTEEGISLPGLDGAMKDIKTND